MSVKFQECLAYPALSSFGELSPAALGPEGCVLGMTAQKKSLLLPFQLPWGVGFYSWAQQQCEAFVVILILG